MYLLPDVFKRLREVAPGIEVEVVASNDVRDLRRREADIAIRHGRPEQPDLIAKLLRETSMHLYASSDYLDQHGRPTSPNDLSEAVFIGFDQSDRLLTRLNEIGLTLTKNNFKLISESGAETCRPSVGWVRPSARLAAEKDPSSAVTRKARTWFQSKEIDCQSMQKCIAGKQIFTIYILAMHR